MMKGIVDSELDKARTQGFDEGYIAGIELGQLAAIEGIEQKNVELAHLRAEAKELRAALRDILRRTRRGDPLGEIASAALKGEP